MLAFVRASSSITARQPVSAQRRSNTNAGPDPPGRHGGRVVLRRGQHHRARREARARAHQPLQLAARLERVQPAEGGDHPLADLAPDPPALGDLEIDPPARGLLAEVHVRLRVARTRSPHAAQKSSKIYQIRGTTFSASSHPQP